MATSFKFYLDSALTEENATDNRFSATQDDLGTLGPVDVQGWFGSTSSALQAKALSDPGVDQITITITDASAGTGEPTTAVKLALTQGGLDTAVAGASLDIGTTVLSGSANAVGFWLRIDDATATVGEYLDLGLETNELVDSAV